jgi:hypothetical protein
MKENQLCFRQYKNEGYSNREISPLIEKNLDIQNILENASKDWDADIRSRGWLDTEMLSSRGIRGAFGRPIITWMMNLLLLPIRTTG